MWPSVLADFRPFSVPLEGELNYPYLDALGWVTTGLGNLAEPLSRMLAMPWLNADGSTASAAAVTAAYDKVDAERSDPKGQKQTSGLATHYGQAFAGLTPIHLSQEGIDGLVAAQLASDETELRRYFHTWDELPADGQLGIFSMTWAMGTGHFAPGGDFASFTAAVNAGDWATADAHSEFKGAGNARRIAANHALFQNAAQVAAQGLDPSVLYYPSRLAAPASGFWPIVGAFVGMVAGVVASVAMARRAS